MPDYQSVRRIAEGVAQILKDADDPKCPLYLTLDLDIAKSLGGMLKDEFKVARDIIAIDGIEVGDLGLHRYRRMLGHHRSHSRHRQVADVSDDPCRLAEF